MPTTYHASWVLPMTAPPIRDAWVLVEDGCVVRVGHGSVAAGRAGSGERAEHVDLGCVALIPGLVNAHTHLELSWMAGRVPPASSMPNWVRELLARRGTGDADAAADATERAIDAMWSSGTALVGDVGNTLASVAALAAGPLHAVVFHELLGFRSEDASGRVAQAVERVTAAATSPRARASLALHAPYSTAPAVFRAVAAAWPESAGPLSVHVAESREEVEFVATGGGAWRDLLNDLGVWDSAWTPPACSPVEYLDRLGVLRPSLLAVHGVHLTTGDLRCLAVHGATLVACPRSNAWTGAGTPRLAAWYAEGVRVALGTDSLASAPDLNLFAELAEARRIAPDVPAGALLRSATIDGARALGWADTFGAIEPGRRAELVAVAVDPATTAVEEDLVRGVSTDRVRRVSPPRRDARRRTAP